MEICITVRNLIYNFWLTIIAVNCITARNEEILNLTPLVKAQNFANGKFCTKVLHNLIYIRYLINEASHTALLQDLLF